MQDVYEAEVSLSDNIELTIMINKAGQLLMQKQNIELTEIPDKVLSSVKERYGAYTVDEAERLEKGGTSYYQFELEKGRKEVHLVFSADGIESKSLSYWN